MRVRARCGLCFSSWGVVEPRPPVDQVALKGKTFRSSQSQLFQVVDMRRGNEGEGSRRRIVADSENVPANSADPGRYAHLTR